MFRPARRNHSFEWMGENYAPLIDTDHFMGRSLLGQKRRNIVPLQNGENPHETTVAEPDDDLEIMVNNDQAGKLLRKAKSPVLILQKPMPQPFSFKTIVFASGLEPDTHEALNRLLQFANNRGVENLHIIEVTTPHNFKPTSIVLAEMQAFSDRHDLSNTWLHNYNHYSVEAGIIEFAESVNADLIAIANHGRTEISSLFIESIPENLVKQGRFPVLSIRV